MSLYSTTSILHLMRTLCFDTGVPRYKPFLICSTCISLLSSTMACQEDRCDADTDEAYCNGNVSVSCERLKDTERFQWFEMACGEGSMTDRPYCITGLNTALESGPLRGDCSAIPEAEPLCYDDPKPLCRDTQRMVCTANGGVELYDDTRCTMPEL